MTQPLTISQAFKLDILKSYLRNLCKPSKQCIKDLDIEYQDAKHITKTSNKYLQNTAGNNLLLLHLALDDYKEAFSNYQEVTYSTIEDGSTNNCSVLQQVRDLCTQLSAVESYINSEITT